MFGRKVKPVEIGGRFPDLEHPSNALPAKQASNQLYMQIVQLYNEYMKDVNNIKMLIKQGYPLEHMLRKFEYVKVAINHALNDLIRLEDYFKINWELEKNHKGGYSHYNEANKIYVLLKTRVTMNPYINLYQSPMPKSYYDNQYTRVYVKARQEGYNNLMCRNPRNLFDDLRDPQVYLYYSNIIDVNIIKIESHFMLKTISVAYDFSNKKGKYKVKHKA